MKISAFLRHKTIHAKIVDRASCTKPAQEKLTERRKACGMVQLWEKMGTADFQILLTKWTKANKILPPVDRVSKLEQWHISLPHQWEVGGIIRGRWVNSQLGQPWERNRLSRVRTESCFIIVCIIIIKISQQRSCVSRKNSWPSFLNKPWAKNSWGASEKKSREDIKSSGLEARERRAISRDRDSMNS